MLAIEAYTGADGRSESRYQRDREPNRQVVHGKESGGYLPPQVRQLQKDIILLARSPDSLGFYSSNR